MVLVDYVMPVMDGAAPVAALRRDPGGRAVEVVVMSGLDELLAALDAYVAGAKRPAPGAPNSRASRCCAARSMTR